LSHKTQILTNPNVVQSLDQFLELGWNLHLEVLVEARLHTEVVRQRWPVVQLRHVALQLLLPAVQLGGLAVQFFLPSLDLMKIIQLSTNFKSFLFIGI